LVGFAPTNVVTDLAGKLPVKLESLIAMLEPSAKF
jgi:hypothetical protein